MTLDYLHAVLGLLGADNNFCAQCENIYVRYFNKNSLLSEFSDMFFSEKHTDFNGVYYYPESFYPKKFFDSMNKFASFSGEDILSLYICVYLLLSEKTFENYRKNGISDHIFKNTFKGMLNAYKNGEFDYRFYANIPGENLFGFESLLYQAADFLCPGFCVPEYPVIKIHVPKGAAFSREKRYMSYVEAYKFFSKKISKTLYFVCDSWLLSKDHAKLLPFSSNIADFRGDFTIVSEDQSFDTGHLRRIFGESDVSRILSTEWKTSLQNIYKKKLADNDPFYSAVGVFKMEGTFD